MKPASIALFLICVSRTVFGCSCYDDNKRSAQNLVFSSFVFEGKVISTSIIVPPESDGMIKALFKVENWLSPKSGSDTISIYTPENSCSLGFSKDELWLIFASPWRGRLRSEYCDGSVFINNNKEAPELLKYFRNLAIGTHDVDIELKLWSGPYHLVGRVENGEPVGRWVKLRGIDTLSFYNFVDGTLTGTLMETDEETTPAERHYYNLRRPAKDALIVTSYDNRKKLVGTCEFRDGPFRIRFQSPYGALIQYLIASNFKHVKCEEVQSDRSQK